MRSRLQVTAAAALASMALLAGCSGEEPREGCLDGLATKCAPAYELTFQDIFTQTLQPSCGRSGFSCHGAEGKQGGLVLVEPDEAYTSLVREPFVIAGDAACSSVVARIEATDPAVRMPPAEPLGAGERCAIIRWIAAGAAR